MVTQITSREGLEASLARFFGNTHGPSDKDYAVGWNLGSDASIVVNRRSPEPRAFVPGGGKLELLYGLVRALRAPGSKVSTLCNPYPGFRTRGRIELAISCPADIVAMAQYLMSLPGCSVALPNTMRDVARKPRQPLRFSLAGLPDEAALHAQLVSFWPDIIQFQDWILRDTELSMQNGRADLCATHRTGENRYLVAELKITSDDRHVVGQILDYMAAISEQAKIPSSNVQGIIICPAPTAHLQRMLQWVTGIAILPTDVISLR
jgi:hypothetical protein